MISIVCIYNNELILKDVLLASLRNQTTTFELIALENIDNKYQSAAEALNRGGEKAHGKYIMFVHQDVFLGSNSWLADAERVLDGISSLGIAGVAGMSPNGRNYEERMRGYIGDCGQVWGNPLIKPEEVQTLDECLLIIPRSVLDQMQFDDRTFDGWHCYGADYCLSIKKLELKAYVLPLFIYHSSIRRNVQNLLRYQRKLYQKHKMSYKTIYTTAGEISWQRLHLLSLYGILLRLGMRLFPNWIELLKKQLSDCRTVLDLGCGYNSPIYNCNTPLFSVGVELFDPYLQESARKHIHSQYIKADVRTVEFKARAFDAVIAIDLLEHLNREEGVKLLARMERWASKKVIILTPNGFLGQDAYDENPFQKHRAGWSVGELQRLGYRVYGIDGWKRLRGYKSRVKYRPVLFWAFISQLTQKMTYYYPRLASQLLAIKRSGDTAEKRT